MTVMRVPADLESQVGRIIGMPFKPKGDTPDGWDCRGCVRWCYREFCGVRLPDYQDMYSAQVVGPSGRKDRARMLAQGLADQWRPVEPQAGATAWLEWLGSAGHVGFMLSPTRILHADVRAGTAIFDLDDPAAAYRLRGAFAPSFITSIIQEPR